jgi:fumarylacetoacetase-like protein
MFCPVDHPMERGWVGRVEGEHVIQLAAQTLQSFFTGGGRAREHAVYPLAAVRFLAPVLHPPSVRVFEDARSFDFANPAALVGPDAEIVASATGLELLPHIAAVVGAEMSIGGFTVCADWRARDASPPKDRDFALGLGPVILTPDELELDSLVATVRVDEGERHRAELEPFDWEGARALAADGTALYPGDILAGPALGAVDELDGSHVVEIEVEPFGTLRQTVSLGGRG